MNGISRADRRDRSRSVLRDLGQEFISLVGIEFEIHAGAEYCRWGLIDGLRERGATVILPLAHMGIGEQLRWYAQAGH